MSTTKLFSIGLIATAGAAAMAMTANAQSRYGNVYDYESGQNCGQACVAPAAPVANTRYGAPVTAAPTYNPAPVYVDCTQVGTCAPHATTVYTQPAPVYTQPAPVYTQPAPTYSTTTYSQAEAVSCPAGTTAQSDGTCLQSGSSSYSTGTTYSSGSTSSYSSSTSYSAEPVSCPAGTTAQSDGTCLQSSSSSYSTGTTYSSTPSYTTDSYSSASTYSSEPVSCPAGTTAQADGTCMQGGSAYTGSTVEIYQGDATTNTSTGYGYTGGSYSGDYLPVRK